MQINDVQSDKFNQIKQVGSDQLLTLERVIHSIKTTIEEYNDRTNRSKIPDAADPLV